MTRLIAVISAFVAIASASSSEGIQNTANKHIANGKAMARNGVKNAKQQARDMVKAKI